jgi:hypothetical protein
MTATQQMKTTDDVKTKHPEIRMFNFPISGTIFGWWEWDTKYGRVFNGRFPTFREALEAYENK